MAARADAAVWSTNNFFCATTVTKSLAYLQQVVHLLEIIIATFANDCCNTFQLITDY